MPVAALQHFKNYNGDDWETDVLMDAVTFFKTVNLKKWLCGELGMFLFQLFKNDQLLPMAAVNSLYLEPLGGETILQLALFCV